MSALSSASFPIRLVLRAPALPARFCDFEPSRSVPPLFAISGWVLIPVGVLYLGVPFCSGSAAVGVWSALVGGLGSSVDLGLEFGGLIPLAVGAAAAAALVGALAAGLI